jgi:integrase
MQFCSRNIMSNIDAPSPPQARAVVRASSAASLYSARGKRKYLTQAERQRVLAAMSRQPTDAALLGLTLAWTGARVSEVLALTADDFLVEAGVIALATLKRRRPVVREVPIPHELMAALDRRYALRAVQQESGTARLRLWRCCRTTVWRQMKALMAEAGVAGRPACPRGLRHGFGVGTLQAGVPITLVQRWLGHAQLRTTAIYTEVTGPEERRFADGFLRWSAARAA